MPAGGPAGARPPVRGPCAAGGASALSKILFADDDQPFREAAIELLESRGHFCRPAEDAATAIQALRGESWDLLIADICMPGNDHLELLSDPALREAPLPVILVTGFPSLETAVESIRLPVLAYLVKPIPGARLIEEVDRAVQYRRVVQALRRLRSRMAETERDLADLDDVLRSQLLSRGGEQIQALLDLSSRDVVLTMAELTHFAEVICSTPVAATSTTSRDEGLAVAEASRHYQLSRRESQVLGLVVDGHRVPQIARQLRISPHTVRNHLKGIFRKVGVTSQGELIELFKPIRSTQRPRAAAQPAAARAV